jgi:hypothetical protein
MATRLHIQQSKQSHDDGVRFAKGVLHGLWISAIIWGLLVVGGMLFARGCSAQELPEVPVVRQAMAHIGIKPIEINRFSNNPTNRWLLRADIGVRMNDAVSTYVMDGTGICPTCRETQLPSALAKNLPGMLMYSFAVHEGIKYGSELLWRHNHHLLARALVIGDIAGDGYSSMHNWTILTSKPLIQPVRLPDPILHRTR